MAVLNMVDVCIPIPNAQVPVNHMARRMKAIETLQALLNDAPRPGRTKGTVSLGMTLCPHPSVSIMVTKSLLMVGSLLGLLSL